MRAGAGSCDPSSRSKNLWRATSAVYEWVAKERFVTFAHVSGGSMHSRRALFMAALAALSLSNSSNASPHDWANASGGGFFAPSNWVPFGVPGAGDGAVFANGFSPGTFAVTFNANPTNFSLIVFDNQPQFFLT